MRKSKSAKKDRRQGDNRKVLRKRQQRLLTKQARRISVLVERRETNILTIGEIVAETMVAFADGKIAPHWKYNRATTYGGGVMYQLNSTVGVGRQWLYSCLNAYALVTEFKAELKPYPLKPSVLVQISRLLGVKRNDCCTKLLSDGLETHRKTAIVKLAQQAHEKKWTVEATRHFVTEELEKLTGTPKQATAMKAAVALSGVQRCINGLKVDDWDAVRHDAVAVIHQLARLASQLNKTQREAFTATLQEAVKSVSSGVEVADDIKEVVIQ